MAPLLRSSNVHDSIGRVVDLFLDPLTYVYFINDVEYGSVAKRTPGAIDFCVVNLEQINKLQAASVDYYATLRSAYQQARQKHIYGENAAFDDFEQALFVPV